MVDQKTILLVNPACLDKRVTDQDDKIMPIGIFYIGALLIENGFQVNILNLADVKNNPGDTFKSRLSGIAPLAIGFSITNPTRLNAIECARQAKKILPDTPIVFGGPAATFLPDHLLKACPDLDFLVTGEGEFTILELAKAFESGSQPSTNFETFKKIKGLVFKHDNEIVKTNPRPSIENLDTLPHPSRHFAFNHLAMSRGCPGKCTFCGSPRFWSDKKVRFHSPEWMITEIQTLVQKGITHFFISDDTFTMDRDRVIALCRLIREKVPGITWNAISRVDYINEDLIQAMRIAGCIQISYGVESGSEKIRKTLGKPVARGQIVRTFKLTTSYGILPRAYFIYGSPGETDQTIKDSINLMQEIKPLAGVFYMLVIFPGTHLYNHAVSKRLINDDVWNEPIEDLPWFEIDTGLSFEKVSEFGEQLRNSFYSSLNNFAQSIDLVDKKELYPYHADFLSRLAMTFSHGEYASDARITNQEETAALLFQKALSFSPDARAFLGLAMLFQKQRNFQSAMDILGKGLGHYRNNQDLITCMGVCQMNMGQFQNALASFESLGPSSQTQYYINICKQNI